MHSTVTPHEVKLPINRLREPREKIIYCCFRPWHFGMVFKSARDKRNVLKSRYYLICTENKLRLRNSKRSDSYHCCNSRLYLPPTLEKSKPSKQPICLQVQWKRRLCVDHLTLFPPPQSHRWLKQLAMNSKTAKSSTDLQPTIGLTKA